MLKGFPFFKLMKGPYLSLYNAMHFWILLSIVREYKLRQMSSLLSSVFDCGRRHTVPNTYKHAHKTLQTFGQVEEESSTISGKSRTSLAKVGWKTSTLTASCRSIEHKLKAKCRSFEHKLFGKLQEFRAQAFRLVARVSSTNKLFGKLQEFRAQALGELQDYRAQA